jgi:hypothetical protein
MATCLRLSLLLNVPSSLTENLPEMLDSSEYTLYRGSFNVVSWTCCKSHAIKPFSFLCSPFGFAGADKPNLYYMREAEIKHGRLAMLAAAGWPIAELFDKPIADSVGLPTLLTKTGESPSILNGGLEKVDIAYWVAIVALAGVVEIENAKMKDEKPKEYLLGDCGFDPLGLFPKEKAARLEMMTKEIKHGRIAMMGIFGFAIQEAVYGIPVVQETPFFFSPLF